MGGMLALGMGVGASIGAATYNIGMWVAIGVAVGVGAAGPTTGGRRIVFAQTVSLRSLIQPTRKQAATKIDHGFAGGSFDYGKLTPNRAASSEI